MSVTSGDPAEGPADGDTSLSTTEPDESAPELASASESEVAGEADVDAQAEALAEIGQRSAAAQARCDAGDFDGAIRLWNELLAEVPRSSEQAPRRASFLLAIVDAHERAYLAEHDPQRLQVAVALLDHYLGELSPTDDENRVVVERRRAALRLRIDNLPAASETRGVDDAGPVAAPRDPAIQARRARRWTIAGGTLGGLGLASFALMGVGMGLGQGADVQLEEALGLSITDPDRESAKSAALAQGVRANGLAYAGGIVGGLLLVGGAVAIFRGRRLRLAPGPVALGVGLRGRF